MAAASFFAPSTRPGALARTVDHGTCLSQSSDIASPRSSRFEHVAKTGALLCSAYADRQPKSESDQQTGRQAGAADLPGVVTNVTLYVPRGSPYPATGLALQFCQPLLGMREIRFERRAGLAQPLLEVCAAFFQQRLHFTDQCVQIGHEIFGCDAYRHAAFSIRGLLAE